MHCEQPKKINLAYSTILYILESRMIFSIWKTFDLVYLVYDETGLSYLCLNVDIKK